MDKGDALAVTVIRLSCHHIRVITNQAVTKYAMACVEYFVILLKLNAILDFRESEKFPFAHFLKSRYSSIVPEKHEKFDARS